MEHLKGTSLGRTPPALLAKIRLGWKGMPGGKHSSLLKIMAVKSFITLGPGGGWCKRPREAHHPTPRVDPRSREP